MECDRFHPCQALADMMTLREKLGEVKRRKIVVSWAYSGSWHKPAAVPQSEVLAAVKMGMDVVLAHPKGFELDKEVIKAAEQFANQAGGSFSITHDMKEAFAGADAVYPKSWCSLQYLPQAVGQNVDEKNMTALFEANRAWICDEAMMKNAKKDALYMHCLPCDRGQEVTDAVVDGTQSVVFDQARNRMHAQNAIMVRTLG
jgi:N-acetylornithine carbamoyltransferase